MTDVAVKKVGVREMGEAIGNCIHGLSPLLIPGKSGEHYKLDFARLHLDKADLQGQRNYEFSDSPLPRNSLREVLWSIGLPAGILSRRQKSSCAAVGMKKGFLEVIVEKRPNYALLTYLELGYLDEAGNQFVLRQGLPVGNVDGTIQRLNIGEIKFEATVAGVAQATPVNPDLEKSLVVLRQRIDERLHILHMDE